MHSGLVYQKIYISQLSQLEMSLSEFLSEWRGSFLRVTLTQIGLALRVR